MTAALPPATAEATAAAAQIDVDVLESAVSIALAGGPDEAAPGWTEWASCRRTRPSTWFPGKGEATGSLLDRCREDCAVQAECLAAALATNETHGIWGGTTAAGRRRLRTELREAGLLGVVGEDAYIAWREDSADREPVAPVERHTVQEPWPHQERAVEAIVTELADGGTCQIQMATATGKTHVALWAAHELAAARVLVLVPSLALITQTAAVWRSDPRWVDVPFLAVCSDTGGEKADLRATTDPADVRAFLEGPGVVFATYQSSEVLVDAGTRFDLTIADEAHHLAGQADKSFAPIVRGEIPTDRTLYMTATPRVLTRRRRNAELDLVSMDPGGPFGPRVFELALGDAVAAGVIADYRVIVAAVEQTTFEQVAAHPDMVDVDPHLLAGAIAVVEAMGADSLASCVSFHTQVERARQFARLVGAVADLLPTVRPPGPGWAGFVHGGASVSIRERLLARLAEPHTWGVLANAKALGEGVDLPALDAVAIVDPKNSETDILQATGRALRRPAGTRKVGTVLLPVLTRPDVPGADPMDQLDQRSMDLVSSVLRALRAHDTELAARLDHTRRAISRTRAGMPALAQALRARAARGLLASRVELHLPGGPTGDLAGAIALHMVREATASWDEAYGRLQDWAEEHGHCRIPQSADVPHVIGAKSSLGAWASRQRTLHHRGLLAPERVAALEALPGWMWDAREEAWWEKVDLLRDFVETHGRYPHGREMWQGVPLGSFVNTCRTAMTTHDNEWLLKFPERIAGLEALPGWTWNARDAWWEEHYQQLRAFAEQHGHASPGDRDVVDGFNLGKWVAKERQKIRAGKRTDDQTARLRALPGWIDDYRQISDALWEDGYQRTARYIAQHDRLVPQGYIEPDGHRLGAWLLKQRQAHLHERRRGVLTPDRIARLEALPHWTWTPKVGGGTRNADQYTLTEAG